MPFSASITAVWFRWLHHWQGGQAVPYRPGNGSHRAGDLHRYADGEPAEKIAASLNERGLRTRTGKPFVKNSFFQIFRNRRYIGEYRYKDIVTPGGIPAIVDEDLFNRVQQRFEQNKIAHGRPAKEDVSYLLTTKLFCGKCGTLMGGESGTSHMGNTYYYYKCGNAKRHGKAHCDLKAIRKEPLERFVVETAIKVIFSDEIIERLIDLIMEAQQQEKHPPARSERPTPGYREAAGKSSGSH